APGAAVPGPQPQAPPPAGTAAIPSGSSTASGGMTPHQPSTAGPEAAAAPDQAGTGLPGSAATASTESEPRETPSAEPQPSAAPSPAAGPDRAPAAQGTVTAYFVLLDDGGNNGVRFGCNDSLIGVDQARPAGKDPLPAAMNALLGAGSGAAVSASEVPPGGEIYNALAGSRLRFLSGSFDGTAVTVYLSGAVSLGGVCDIPRLEAQLTQTALAAVGAVRAQVYLNGRPLAEVLRLEGAGAG
ncbi:hypothetical protein, partial [Pseudarthrobacter chlorophenolicus]|uniref:hypothetical protein n=1 Tax=Pseudarthrobacter chlorophenolicus TaxID=85085 RepID=UPI000A7C9578